MVRILFSGLMAFVPSDNGQELTVLLLNVPAAHQHLSDGTMLHQHNPLLIARAGNCSGDCPTTNTAVGLAIASDKTVQQRADLLTAAIQGGAIWQLNESDLSVQKGNTNDPALPALQLVTNARGTVSGLPRAIPTSASEREDFSWIAKMSEICPSGCTLDADLLGENPPEGLIAARFRLRTGKAYTFSVARIGDDVSPVIFRRLDGSAGVSGYSQAVATWVAADIEVEGDSIQIVEDGFDGEPGRSMILEPAENEKVEIAVLNLPSFVPPASATNNNPQVGKHFESYYGLMESPLSAATRLVPVAGPAGDPETAWSLVHPLNLVDSPLLSAIRLDIGRTAYDRVLCPPFTP